MKRLAETQVTVVGLGLMGGSLAGALRGHCRLVVGVARRPETVEVALARGLVDRGTTDLAAGVQQADVVVLATPVRVILRLLDEIGPLLPAGCLVMDLGSTKAEIVGRMARLPEQAEPLGGHPMCGREVAGIAASDATLYRGCVFVLSPLERTSGPAMALARALVQAVGGRPMVVEAARHDRLVATISHLPYLLAGALVATAEAAASSDPLLWELAAGGFRDTSRLAASDVTMVLDILLTNREPVLAALDVCREQLCELYRLLQTGDEPALGAKLRVLRERRMGILAQDRADHGR